jgi:hypothetical protein
MELEGVTAAPDGAGARMLTSHSRGQTLPIWTMGIALALVMAFAALQYGQVLRWQIRAQNAADAAAAGALSVQTSAWNQQIALLYAAAVEEYRLRQLIGAMMLAANNDASCQPPRPGATSCAQTFAELRRAYAASLQRYTTDVQLISRASQYTLDQAKSDARAIVADFQAKCGQANGGDCAFTYNVVDVSRRSGSVNDVEMSANVWAVNTTGLPGGGPANVKDDYAPAQIEIVTCAKVDPIVPSFLGFTPPTFTAVGRAAATSAMVTQEWIQPGYIVNPQTGGPFQPIETWASGGAADDGKHWYSVDFGGNQAKVIGKVGYLMLFSNEEFSVATGWWNTIPIKPYHGTLADTDYTCR